MNIQVGSNLPEIMTANRQIVQIKIVRINAKTETRSPSTTSTCLTMTRSSIVPYLTRSPFALLKKSVPQKKTSRVSNYCSSETLFGYSK